MKRLLVVLLGVTLMVTGCNSNIDQEEVRNEQAVEITSLQSALEAADSEVKVLESEKEELIDLMKIKDNEITSLKEEVSSLNEALVGLNEAKEEVEALVGATPAVVLLADTVAELIRDQDFNALSTYVHPTAGVRFTPYPYIDLSSDLIMTASQVSLFGTDATVYNWGNYDGSGDPIQLTPMGYYMEFVYDEDYATPEMMSWNAPIGTGNMINNLMSIYPASDYVEFHFSGFNAQYAGMDWSSMTLVFEQVGATWYLVGIIHGQWTI